MMKPAARELFRLSLLRQLDDVTPAALRTASLVMLCRAQGFTVTEVECTAELHYLVEKGLAARAEKTLSPEIPEWRITAPGRDFVAQQPIG